VEDVFCKDSNTNPNMFAKLVEKGSKFDKEKIANIYGKNTNNAFNSNGGG
jgi:hypothetical protein